MTCPQIKNTAKSQLHKIKVWPAVRFDYGLQASIIVPGCKWHSDVLLQSIRYGGIIRLSGSFEALISFPADFITIKELLPMALIRIICIPFSAILVPEVVLLSAAFSFVRLTDDHSRANRPESIMGEKKPPDDGRKW